MKLALAAGLSAIAVLLLLAVIGPLESLILATILVLMIGGTTPPHENWGR